MNGEIDIQQIHSSDNLADLFTKVLPTSKFRKLIYKIGMRKPKVSVLYYFSIRPVFCPTGFFPTRFLMRQY